MASACGLLCLLWLCHVWFLVESNSTALTTKSQTTILTTKQPPPNPTKFIVTGQNETSITLRWDKVGNYTNYALKVNGTQINVSALAGQATVTQTVTGLTAAKIYHFSLYTVFEGVISSGLNTTAVTAPTNVINMTVSQRSESSVTLRWDRVHNHTTYRLQYNSNGTVININITDDSASAEYRVSLLSAGTSYTFIIFTVFEGVRSSEINFTAVSAPPNPTKFIATGQNETSITLRWHKVGNYTNYALKVNRTQINVSALAGQATVTQTVTGLTAAKIYHFSLYTVFEGVMSSGLNTTAVTAPTNVINMTVSQRSESSVTLRWDRVHNHTTYRLQYNSNGTVININITDDNASVEYRVSLLSAGTSYTFIIFTVFEGVRSSGINFTAVSAPPNPTKFIATGQNETSITLRWHKVVNYTNYALKVNRTQINVSALAGQATVTQTVTGLTAAKIYHFSLYTVFEGVMSSGLNTTAVTAPLNPYNISTASQNETSITLRWDNVGNYNYTLEFDGTQINVSALAGQATVTQTVLGLTAAKRYHFTLYTVFEGVMSSGLNTTAVTAPTNVINMTVSQRSESSVTLRWDRVHNHTTYRLQYNSNGTVININITDDSTSVEYRVSLLSAGTSYTFIIFTVFEGVNSSGFIFTAVSAPLNPYNISTASQNETSITLQWDNVGNYNYTLKVNGTQIHVSAPEGPATVTQTVLGLTAATRYNVSLYTVFEGVMSSGLDTTAVTAPSPVSDVIVTRTSANSVMLRWGRTDGQMVNYILNITGKTLNITPASTVGVVSQQVDSLRSGTLYNFTVLADFYGVLSVAYTNFTVTAIDCDTYEWTITNSSIYGTVPGLFSEATVSNGSGEPLVSLGNPPTVSFSNLYPGSTYNVSLVYVKDSQIFPQCNHKLTLRPPNAQADCENSGSGYSMKVVLATPLGFWTSAKVNVSTGAGDLVANTMFANDKLWCEIPGFQPARSYLVSVELLAGTTKSTKPYVFNCNTDPRGVIAGSVLGVILLCLLVALVAFILLKRRETLGRSRSHSGGFQMDSASLRAIPVGKFPEHFKNMRADENLGFTEEYERFRPVGTDQTQKAATLPGNSTKNRFTNVLPYDWSRVKLQTQTPDGISDYINANYMTGYSGKREYIAAQGPLRSTVADFWRMVWEQDVTAIVMVTNCTEKGRVKCEQYWPLDYTPCQYGGLLVTVTSETREASWTFRTFEVKNKLTLAQRTVQHFHFTAWPDHGVPDGTEELVQFRGLIRQHRERHRDKAPTVVHCSAGVGRTGTLIALDVLLQQVMMEGAVGVAPLVHKMRQSRPLMVQTESQYIFLHQCIMDALQPKENIYENSDMVYENSDMIYENASVLAEYYANRTSV